MLPEFAEMLCALYDEDVDYLVVGGYAIGVHVEPRATKDLDIFVRPSRANAPRVLRALARFRAPSFGLTAEDLAAPGLILQIGVAPRRIDLITDIDGVAFAEAWRSRLSVRIDGVRAPVSVIGRASLIKNKRAIVAKDAANRRPQDRADLVQLERAARRARTRK